jgi:RNA polymerase sigma-70 factor (ECF subfamily)
MSALPAPPTRPSLLVRITDPADRTAWGEFVGVYGPLVYGEVIRRRVPSSDAEDLTQQVFVRLVRALPVFRYRPANGRFRDWLGTVVRNEVTRFWRSNGRRPARPTDPNTLAELTDDTADSEWSDAFQARVLAAAMERCRPRFEPNTWEAFVQVWARNRPPAEVAAELGQTTDWVYVAKSRALKALADEVSNLTDLFPFSDAV